MGPRKVFVKLMLAGLFMAVCYGGVRLYFHLTDGFSLANITSDFTFQPQWAVRQLTSSEQEEADRAMDQSYHYLGKGCQSYVFLSDDGKYVIKFFKYQRFRIQPWLTYFPPLPALVKYREEKLAKKWTKLNGFVISWKLAFEYLKEESGLVLVHLNKSHSIQKQLTIFDKMGKKYSLDLDQMEFCIQRKAELLKNVLLRYKAHNDLPQAKRLITNLLNLILSEYSRGLADNDHALMQNTGVIDNQPIHIDVGQFYLDPALKDPTVYHQELFTKTYHLKRWLIKHYPSLGAFLEEQLKAVIGPAYEEMQPRFHPHWNR